MPPELLAEVLDEIHRQHALIHVDEALDDNGVRAGDNLRFAITVDDGYRDNYTHLFPLLAAQQVPATIYLAIDYLDGTRRFWYERLQYAIQNATGTELDAGNAGLGTLPLDGGARRTAALIALNDQLKAYDDATREQHVDRIVAELLPEGDSPVSPMLDWEMVREMAAAGVRFGSHTFSHPILSRETEERVARETAESRTELEKRLGTSVTGFAYPNGTPADFNDDTVAAVRRAGYRHACTTVSGVNRPGDDCFRLRRINLHPGMCTDPRGRFSNNLFWAKVLGVFG
jgi:peptidoglycan/xylan/chitin deacetylase (PgdA/CDA1 family)